MSCLNTNEKNKARLSIQFETRIISIIKPSSRPNTLYHGWHIYLQLKKELSGMPLVETADQTLPLCWKGKKPFKSIRDVKKFFKTFTLSFRSNGRTKTKFDFTPEAYLITSVSQSFNRFPPFILQFCAQCNQKEHFLCGC